VANSLKRMVRPSLSFFSLMIFLLLIFGRLLVPFDEVEANATNTFSVTDHNETITIKTQDFTYAFNKSLGSFISATMGTFELVGTWEGKKIFNRFSCRENSTGSFVDVENIDTKMNLTTTIKEQALDSVVFQSHGYLRTLPPHDGSEGKIFVTLTYNVTSYNFVTLNATFESKIPNNYADDLYYIPNVRFFWNNPHKYDIIGSEGGVYAVWNDQAVFVATLMKTYTVAGINSSTNAGPICVSIRHPSLLGEFHITNHQMIMSFHLFKVENFRNLWRKRIFLYMDGDCIPSESEINTIRKDWRQNVIIFFDQWSVTWGNWTPYNMNDFQEAIRHAHSLNMKIFLYFSFLYDESLQLPSDWIYASSGIHYFMHGSEKSFYLIFVNEPFMNFLYNKILWLKQNYDIDGIYFDFYDATSKNQVSDGYYRMLLVKKLKDLGLDVIAHSLFPYSSPMLFARFYGENYEKWTLYGPNSVQTIMSNGTFNVAALYTLPKDSSMFAYTLTHGISVFLANGTLESGFYNYNWNEDQRKWVLSVLEVYNQFDTDIIRIYPYWNTSYNMNANVTTYELHDRSYVAVIASLGKGVLQPKLNLTNIITNGNYHVYDLLNEKSLGIYPENQPSLTINNNTAIALRLTPIEQPQIIKHSIVDSITQTFIDRKLLINVSSPYGTTTLLKIFCGEYERPNQVLIDVHEKSEGSVWSYDSSSRILSVKIDHSGSDQSEVVVNWGTIIDLNPPIISKIDHSPSYPEYDQVVTVKANISDQQSGVETVILSYYNGSHWMNVTMVPESLFTATVPAMPYGTTVQYKVYASDKAGNWATSQIYSYQVRAKQATTGLPTEILIVVILIVSVFIGVVVYLGKLLTRTSGQKKNKREQRKKVKKS